MDADGERQRKIEEGRRRLEKMRRKKDDEKHCAVHVAKKPLPSPFATTVKPFKLPETNRSKSPREMHAPLVAANKENVQNGLVKDIAVANQNEDEVMCSGVAAHVKSPLSRSGVPRGVNFGTGREAQLQAAVAFAAVPEPAERVDAPTAQDAQPYITDGVVFTSYPATSTRTSRTAFSIRREEGMRVDAMMGEAEGEDEKTLMIQSLRAMVDGLKRQIASDSEVVEEALEARKKAESALAGMRSNEALVAMPPKAETTDAPTHLQQLPPSYFQDLQESADALRDMRAQRDALEGDFAALLTDKHAVQTQLADSSKALTAEQHRLQETRGENVKLMHALEALQDKLNKVIYIYIQYIYIIYTYI
jgi:hypothetical protein